MALPDWVRPFDLSRWPTEVLTRFGGVLTEQVQDLERVHSRMFDNIRIHRRWADAVPRTTVKNTPWPHASNIVVPVIRTAVDANTARQFSLIQSTRRTLWTGSSEDETFATEYLGEILRFANWSAQHEYDTFWCLLDAIQANNVEGCAVLSVTWEEQERFLFLPNGRGTQRVNMRRGPKWTYWPAEKILWEPGQSVRDSEMVVTQTFDTWGELTRRSLTQEGYHKPSIEHVYNFPHHHGSPGAEVTADAEDRAGIDSTANLSRRRIYDRRTLWIDWPAISTFGVRGLQDNLRLDIPDPNTKDSDRPSLPIIVELCPDAKTILRVMPNPYINTDGNCFFDIYFRRQSGYPRGIGLAKIGEHFQRAMSALANQSFDAITLANSMTLKTTNNRVKNARITPNSITHVDDITDLVPIGLQKTVLPDIQMANFLQIYFERASGVNDPLIGRESRSGGHPSPATNFLGMLQQSAEMGSLPVRMLRQRISEMGEYTMSLYQLFDTDETGRIERVFGAADAARINSWLFPNDQTIVGNAKFDLYALSETENPQSAMQKAMTISQVTQAYYGSILQMMPHLANPQTPPMVKQALLKAIETMGVTHQQFLESADFDKAREAIFTLQEQGANNAAQLQQFADLIRSAAGQPGAEAGAGPGQPPGGSAFGAALGLPAPGQGGPPPGP